jgi:nicotinate-nucleotide adenylyltransferase
MAVHPRFNTSCLYFGTFNPIHTGHLMIAQAVMNRFAESLGLREVVFIPAGVPPHRRHENDLLDARRRLRMVSLATADHPAFRVDDIELRQSGTGSAPDDAPGYTVDTLRRLHEAGKIRFPVPLIIGADALAGLATWREPEALVDMARFLQAPRPGCGPVYRITLPSGEPGGESRILPLNTHQIDMPPLALSSSWIRQQLKEGGESVSRLRYFLPEPVRRYIRDNRLYRTENR